MKDFSDAVWKADLFQVNDYCSTDSPSVSMVPTASPAPSEQLAPSCASRPYTAPKSTPFYQQRGVRTPPWRENAFEVQGNCNYRVKGQSVNGVQDFDTPEKWLDYSATLFNLQLIVDNGVTFTGGVPALSDFVVEGAVAKIKEGNGISGGDKTWQFGTNTESSAFVDLFYNITRDAPKVWDTNSADDMKCGSTSDFCYDKKTHTSCYVDPVSDNCGQYDYVIDGETDYVRAAKITPWFNACVESYGCRRGNNREIKDSGGGRVQAYKGKWDFRMNNAVRWVCETEEKAKGMKDFADAVHGAKLFDVPDGECTSSPTMSPTMCSDGFLTQASLNIAVVIDISYSTYLTAFDGKTAVGDVNNDGTANTILDAEIAAVLALLNEIARSDILDNSNTDIGIILFDTEAYYKTAGYASKGIYAPLQLNPDGSREPNPELVADLKSLQTLLTNEDVLVNNKGFTNFDDALDKAIDFFKDPALTLEGRTNLMVFLSDGKPNVRGDGDVSNIP
jgi:hypothetical protein